MLSAFKGLHIVFIGDSLIHYQYLSLTYLFRHGNEINENMAPSPTEHNWRSWDEMFLGSNAMFFPFEACDCYRYNDRFDPGNIFTNRYYADPKNNVSTTYINFGWNHEYCQGRSIHETILNSSNTGVWKFSLLKAISTHLIRLQQRPTGIIMNAALFRNQFHNMSYCEDIVKAVRETIPNAQLFWRTTTYHPIPSQRRRFPPYGHPHANFSADSNMCSIEDVICLNIDWSKHLKPDVFLDDLVHYKTPIYNKINRQFLQILLQNQSFQYKKSFISAND